VINDLQEGIFFSKLVCTSPNDTIEIDSRTSDALALAVRMGCPIYTYESIFDKATQTSRELPEYDVPEKESSQPSEMADNSDLKSLTLEELQSLLDEVLEHEDYRRAIAIRDEIKSRETK
jgi:bifunctional DNase/RNase